MSYDCCCADVTLSEWNKLMEGAKPFDYQTLVELVKKYLPKLYEDLCLWCFNPYAEQCCETPTHYVLVHSAIEFFIRK